MLQTPVPRLQSCSSPHWNQSDLSKRHISSNLKTVHWPYRQPWISQKFLPLSCFWAFAQMFSTWNSFFLPLIPQFTWLIPTLPSGITSAEESLSVPHLDPLGASALDAPAPLPVPRMFLFSSYRTWITAYLISSPSDCMTAIRTSLVLLPISSVPDMYRHLTDICQMKNRGFAQVTRWCAQWYCEMGVLEKAFRKTWWLHLTGKAGICPVKTGGEEVLMMVEGISRRKRKEHMQRQGRAWQV